MSDTIGDLGRRAAATAAFQRMDRPPLETSCFHDDEAGVCPHLADPLTIFSLVVAHRSMPTVDSDRFRATTQRLARMAAEWILGRVDDNVLAVATVEALEACDE